MEQLQQGAFYVRLVERSERIVRFLLMCLHLLLHVSDAVVSEYKRLNALQVVIEVLAKG